MNIEHPTLVKTNTNMRTNRAHNTLLCKSVLYFCQLNWLTNMSNFQYCCESVCVPFNRFWQNSTQKFNYITPSCVLIANMFLSYLAEVLVTLQTEKYQRIGPIFFIYFFCGLVLSCKNSRDCLDF